MNICLHTYYEVSDPYIGGTQTLLIKLAKELIVLGHEVFIVCSSLKSHFVIEGVDIYGVIPKQYHTLLRSKYDGIPSSKFLKDAFFNGHTVKEALTNLAAYSYEQYSQFPADIYHVNSYIAAFSQSDVTSIPIVAYQHENEIEFDGFWGAGAFNEFVDWLNEQEERSLKSPRLFTASQYYASHFSLLFNRPIHSVHLGVLLNDMMCSKAVSTTEETDFGRNDSSVVILIPSRFNTKQKGQDLAIEACDILMKKGYNLEVVFTGIKNSLMPDLDMFRKKYKGMGIASHMHFISAKDMHSLYESAHIVLSPERYCSYGLSISESLSLGIMTVLSDIPTYLEIASGVDHAFFFKSDDLNDLIEKLEHVIVLGQKTGYRNIESAISFRINNDIRRTAVVFSGIYKSLSQ